MFAHGSASLQLFPVVWIFLRFLGVICYDRWVLSESHKKLLHGLVSHSWTHSLFLTCYEACEPGNFELLNSLKRSFANVWGLCSNFLACKSFLESKSPDILALCETNLDDSIDSGNFSVRGYRPLIWRILVLICMVLQFMWREDFLFHGAYFWETQQILNYVFYWPYFTKCLTSFSSINHLLQRCAWFLILFYLT